MKNETKPQDIKAVKDLEKYRGMVNIADDTNGADLSIETLSAIGDMVITGIAKDEESREEWLDRYDKSINNAMQKGGTKNYPIDNAANVKYPMIASAAQQFHARSYGAIIKGNDIVKGKVTVPDPKKEIQAVADAVAKHMSNQLLEETPGWVEGLDKTLGILPVVGCVFRKTYFSSIKRMIASEYITAKDVIIKYDAESLETAPRVTHAQTYSQNDIISFVRSGEWSESALDIFMDDIDDIQDFDYCECHTWYDLDGDGYSEPYIITVEKETGRVVRMVARYDLSGITTNNKGEIIKIKPVEYFTRYIFLTSPDGGIYGMGFGTLIGPINDVVDTLINQLIDAGTISNASGGFISSKITLGKKRQRNMPFKQNEWKIIEGGSQRLADSIFPLPAREPSSVLFSLLGMMIDTGKQLSSVTELMTGESRGANESPTTIMALIEQGTMVFTAIYKRIYQALKSEFGKVYRLNQLYTKEMGGDDQLSMLYRDTRFGIIPIADPQDATNTQKIAKANALMQLQGQGLNDMVIKRRYLEALDIENIEEILNAPQAPPNPLLQIEAQKAELEKIKVNLQTDKQMLERQKFEFDMMVTSKIDRLKTVSETILNIAKAEETEVGPQLESYKQQAMSLMDELEAVNAAANQNGRLGSVENKQGNESVMASPEEQGIPNDGGVFPDNNPENVGGADINAGTGYEGEAGSI